MPFILEAATLSPNTLSRHLTLKLSEGQQHVQRESTHRRGCVELLGDRDKRHSLLVKGLNNPSEVGEGSGETVDLIHHNGVNFAGGDVDQELLESRPLHVATGEAAVIVSTRQHLPALMFLAQDVGFTCVAARS
jgi:hypothetical protein